MQGCINQNYWNKSFDLQRQWIFKSVSEVKIKRKIVTDENRRRKNRSCSREYSLPTEDGVYEKVCQKSEHAWLYFLNTFNAVKGGEMFVPQSTRGKHTPANKKSEECFGGRAY